MSVGGYVSDLEVGDRLEPVRYVMSPFVVREYCHGVGEQLEEFHADGPVDVQLAPPTLAHIDKIRLLKRNCPDGPGPTARIHYRFRTKHHGLIPVGAELEARGLIAAKKQHKGRTHLDMEIQVVDASNGALVIECWDTAIISFEPVMQRESKA